MLNKKVHFKKGIEFKGTVVSYDEKIQKFKIKIDEWIGKGYPHLIYWLTEEEIQLSC